MGEVKEALVRVLADEDFDSNSKGSFALLGYTGSEKVVWLKQVSKPRGQGPAKIITFFVTPEGAERMRNYVHHHFYVLFSFLSACDTIVSICRFKYFLVL